jgi:hypothetical protein
MRKLVVPASIAALAAALVTTAASSASSLPFLRSARASNGHVVVTFAAGDLVPARLVVAVRRTTAPSGRLLVANTRLNEPLRAVKTPTGYRARTRHALAPGTYYVQVSGAVIMTDCMPKRPCPLDWSNVLRVRVGR